MKNSRWYRENRFIINLILIPVLVIGGYFLIFSQMEQIVDFHLDAEETAYILLKSGTTGRKIAITEREDIEYICENFNSVSVVYHPQTRFAVGYYLDIQFFGHDDEAAKAVRITPSGGLAIGEPIEGSEYVDTVFLEAMLEKYPESDIVYPKPGPILLY